MQHEKRSWLTKHGESCLTEVSRTCPWNSLAFCSSCFLPHWPSVADCPRRPNRTVVVGSRRPAKHARLRRPVPVHTCPLLTWTVTLVTCCRVCLCCPILWHPCSSCPIAGPEPCRWLGSGWGPVPPEDSSQHHVWETNKWCTCVGHVHVGR